MCKPEVEFGKVQRLLGLLLSKVLGYLSALKVVVIHPDVEELRKAFEKLAPVF